MTEKPLPTEVKSASEILKASIPKDCLWDEMDKLTNTPIRYVTAAMHTHTEQALREFAKRVMRDSFYKIDDAQILSIRDSLLTEIRKGNV